ncbi:MAG: hypothetical protein ACFFBD_29940 [Candidatus Hodarchaeota archaeon]
MPSNLAFPSERQAEIWKLRRNNVAPSIIADQFQVKRPVISKALRVSTTKINKLLEDTIRANKLIITKIDPVSGFVWAHSPIFNTPAYVTYSPKNKIQVWYGHEGECTDCDLVEECKSAILLEVEERNLSLPDPNASPSSLCDQLIDIIMAQLDWK